MKKALIPLILIFLLLVSTQIATAIGESKDSDNNDLLVDSRGEIFEFSGAFVDDDEEINVRVEGVEVGDTIYVYASGLGLVDTYLFLLDEDMRDVFIEDDNSGGGFNAAFAYEVQENSIFNIGLITTGKIGNYQLHIGINTPEVMSDSSETDIGSLPTVFDTFDCADAELGDRPVLSGAEEVFEEENFVIHYTTTGHDATTLDWVEGLAESLNLSLDIQLNELGWALPPADCGEGGDSRLDVYVMDVEGMGAIGIARQENIVGDNPNTEGQEYYAAYSYLIIENDMAFANKREAMLLMQLTAAHEIHHNIQFGYDVNDRFFAMYEAGATWIETIVYPKASGAGSDVEPVFSEPDRCIGSFKGRAAGDTRIYGEWLMIDSFVRDLGPTSYQYIWDAMVERQGLWGFYQALEELGTTPQEVIERMAIRNLLYDYNLAKYFEDTVAISARIDGQGRFSSFDDGIQELGVDYVRIRDLDVLSIELLNSPDLTMFVVGIEEDKGEAQVYDIGQSGTVDLRDYDHAYLMILNTLEHTNSDNCHYTNWQIQVVDGTGEPLAVADDEIWDASQFVVAK